MCINSISWYVARATGFVPVSDDVSCEFGNKKGRSFVTIGLRPRQAEIHVQAQHSAQQTPRVFALANPFVTLCV
jgi:hypothetical protein